MTDAVPYRPDSVQPLTEEADFFGHADYAQALCGVVAEVPAPFTLGLFGPWGAGKSSILHETANRLNAEDGVAAVVFDVWKYEGDPLRRAFVRDVGEQLDTAKRLKKGFKLKGFLERFDADVTNLRPTLSFDWRPIPKALYHAVLVGALALVLLVGLPFLGVGVTGAEGKKVLLAVLSGAVAFMFSALGQTVRIDQVQIARKRIEDSDEFAASFEELLRNGLAVDRLVIGIDNLDRCSPERVTELLATIKTFLEPTRAGKQLIFVIAADDSALRRHLVAQELASSGGERSLEVVEGDAGSPERPSIPAEVREAVDEYLRKFFNGTLRLTEVLDEDIRDFAQAQLAPFIAAHDLDDSDASQLVELVATALKHNPRRIKQFINGLELRLQLLDRRYRAKRIQAKPELLVVAKLAIIEEEWPTEFADLKEDPRRLATWHEGARSGQGQQEEDLAYSRWQVFLRNTESIRATNLRPYITLKQTRRELDLPRYQEFVEALEEARRDALKELFEDPDVDAKRDEYLGAIPERLRETIIRNYAGGAANIVRSAIEAPELRPQAAGIVEEALRHPPLRERLSELRPEPLLEAASDLSNQAFNEVVAALLIRFEQTEEGAGEGRASISEALASRLGSIDETRRSQLSRAFKSEGVRRDFGSYLDIAESDGSLLPDDVLLDALATLDGQPSIDAEEPTYRVAKSVLLARDEPSHAHVQKMGEVVTKALIAELAAEEGETAFNELAEDAAEALRSFDVPRTSFQQPMADLNDQWAAAPAGVRSSLMDFAGALLDAGTDEAREQYGAPFVERFFAEDPAAAIRWVASRSESINPPFVEAGHEQLALYVSGESGDPALAEQAKGAVSKFPREQQQDIALRAMTRALEQGRYGRGAEILRQSSRLLTKAKREPIVDRLLSAGDVQPLDSHPDLLTAIAEIAPSALSSQQKDRRATILVQAVLDDEGEWRPALDVLLGQPEFEGHAGELISRVFERLAADSGQLASQLEYVRLAIDERRRLDEAQMRQLGVLLMQALQHATASYPPGPVAELAQLLGRLDFLALQQRGAWVTDLIVMERQLGDIEVKDALLRAASSLAGGKRSKSWKEVAGRIRELKRGSDEEKGLGRRLEADH